MKSILSDRLNGILNAFLLMIFVALYFTSKL